MASFKSALDSADSGKDRIYSYARWPLAVERYHSTQYLTKEQRNTAVCEYYLPVIQTIKFEW